MLARIRQWIAVVGVGTAATLYLQSASHYGGLKGMFLWDPATPIFYLLSVVGLACRFFWARYLVICFSASMLAIDLSSARYLAAACCAGLILLLVGKGMRELFEGRDGRWNRWAARTPQLDRLKLLFVAQSVALGLLYAHRYALSDFGWTSLVPIAVGGLGICGLALQKTWSALLLLPAILIETAYVWKLYTSSEEAARYCGCAHHMQPAPAILLAAVIVSLLLIAPLLAGIWRFLRADRVPRLNA